MRKTLIVWINKRIPARWWYLIGAGLFIYVLFVFTMNEKPSTQSISDLERRRSLSQTRYFLRADKQQKGNAPKDANVRNVDPMVHSQKVEEKPNLMDRDSEIANVPQDRLLDKVSLKAEQLKQEVVAPPQEVRIPHLYFHEEGLGQNGKGVSINKSSLTEHDRQALDQGYERNAFNEYVSNLISVDRSVPETRDPLCWTKTYPTDLPDTSVIMCFLNEAWSVLVRSVHSVINTSPPHLLREIILVDDHSDYEHLKAPLEAHMKKFPKVKIIRNSAREGLIRSRLNGAKVATGQVLTFLDSHIECATGWLPPLLARIKENSSHVVCPGILGIDGNTFQFIVTPRAADLQVGIFSWKMSFTWELPNLKERETVISPIKSPTMAGGLFSMDREYFYHTGSYDEEMLFWGGENLEMSFRIWMCGGTMEIIPCSLVGHIFRERNVNGKISPKGASTTNTNRMVMVWTDQYKYLYAKVTGQKLENYGNISSRLALREKLKCKSFDWYLTNVYQSVFLPQKAVMSGIIHSRKEYTMCLQGTDDTRGRVRIDQCNKMDFQGQVFYVTKYEEIRLLSTCLDAGNGNLVMYPCHRKAGNQRFVYKQDNTIFNAGTRKCLQWMGHRAAPRLVVCDRRDLRQQWVWEKVPLDFLTKPDQ